MFNMFHKKSFGEKCVDGVLNGLAAVGDVVIATGEIVGDAVDALTTPSPKRETVIIHHERPIIERKVTIVTPSTSWVERETLRLQQENLRMERELADRRRREAAYEEAKARLIREHEARINAVRVVLDDTIITKRGNTYRVKLLLKGSDYKVVVRDCDLGITIFDEVYYDAVRAYDAFSNRRIVLKNK